MPLDQVLIKHLDKQDELVSQIENDIETIVSGIDIDEIIKNPEAVLTQVVEDIQAVLKEQYYHLASENGINLAKEIEDDGDIKIVDSNDPNLNEGVLSGNQGES